MSEAVPRAEAMRVSTLELFSNLVFGLDKRRAGDHSRRADWWPMGAQPVDGPAGGDADREYVAERDR